MILYLSSLFIRRLTTDSMAYNCPGVYRASLIAHWQRICLQCRRPWFNSWVRKIRWRRDKLPIPVFLGCPGRSAGKESACNAGDLGSIPGLGRSPGEGKGYPLQYSGLENFTDCTPHGVAKSWTQLSDFHFTSLHFTIISWVKPSQEHLTIPQGRFIYMPQGAKAVMSRDYWGQMKV